jgi:hypothetical protein
MFLKKLITPFPHFFPRPFIKKEAFQLRKEFFFSGYLDRSPRLNQTAGDFQEIKHIRTEENTLSEKQRLKGIVASHWDKTSTDEDQCPETINAHQFAHCIEENHLSLFVTRSAP